MKKLLRWVNCFRCGGYGTIYFGSCQSERCPECNGSKVVWEEE